ncbi:MAG: putative Zn-dependent protease [Candidatus Azotimanducaceae bacterium]|jgi:predicted Zn-dependent protease
MNITRSNITAFSTPFSAIFAAALGALALSLSLNVFAVSLEEEIKLGQEEHRKIIAQFGVYRDKDLQTYVDMVGQRVAKQSSRPELVYTFTILNDEMINAMALPGGFVYVTRGILTHMNSESELAAVLGHEIAHVTQKHAFKSQNRGKAVRVLSTVAAVLTQNGAIAEIGDLFGGVLLKGYGREMELEADRVGAEYMAKAGYSPDAMLKTIEILKNKDRIEYEQARLEKRQPRVYHGFLSTHPDSDTRFKEAVQASMKLIENYDEFIQADEFLEKLNGLSYGNARQSGIVRKQTFYHPKLGIKLNFPDDWRMESVKNGVKMVSQTGDAVFALSTARIKSDQSVRDFAVDSMGLDIRDGRAVTIGNLDGFLGIANRADSTFGPRPIRFAILQDKRRRIQYILIGAGKHDLHNIANDGEFIATIFSFDKMDAEDRKVAKAPRIQILRAEEGTTMEALAEQSPITNYALDKLRVMNGLYPYGQPKPGQLIKVID